MTTYGKEVTERFCEIFARQGICVISGLSKVVMVVEGERRSGTLITASNAANQGKTVYATPGSINSPMSQAPLYLMQNGSKIAENPKDILQEFGK
jgi:DNA processing protein